MVFDEAGDINDGVDPHVVDDIKNIVDLELESDKAAEELATISDEHHVREAGQLLLHLVGCLPCFCRFLSA